MSALVILGLLALVLVGGGALPWADEWVRSPSPHPLSGRGWGEGEHWSAHGVAIAQGDAPAAATPEQLVVLREVLARPEFGAAAGRGVLDRVLDPVRSALRRALGEVLRLVGRLLDGRGEAIGYGVLAVGLAITIVAGLVVRRLLHGAVAADAELAATRPDRLLRAEEELARARALADAGEPRAAVHHLYLAVLRRLDERGLLRFDRALTNRELLPRVPSDAAVGVPLAPLVARFDRLWYGQSTCSRKEYEGFARLADQVWEAAA